jgi:N-acetylneuraminic acid mutarotase
VKQNITKYVIFRSRFKLCVAVLGDVLYVMGGSVDFSSFKTAERYNPKTDRWSPIADMNVKRSGASATALNGNMNIMKQEGIRTKGVAK